MEDPSPMQNTFYTSGILPPPGQVIHISCKVKARRKDQAEIAKHNNQVDSLTKQAALVGKEYLWTKSDKIYKGQLAESEIMSQVDIIDHQKADKVQDLLSKEEYRGYKLFKNKNGIIMAQREDVNNVTPVLVVPECLRKELINLSHNQGHFGVEKNTNRILSMGWWLEITRDV
ncbi:unnamed protein product [Caretta caretta]